MHLKEELINFVQPVLENQSVFAKQLLENEYDALEKNSKDEEPKVHELQEDDYKWSDHNDANGPLLASLLFVTHFVNFVDQEAHVWNMADVKGGKHTENGQTSPRNMDRIDESQQNVEICDEISKGQPLNKVHEQFLESCAHPFVVFHFFLLR